MVAVSVSHCPTLQSILCAGLSTDPVSAGPIDTTIVPAVTIVNDSLVPCEDIIGYLAVYRVCMGLASFFFLMMLIMLCVFSSRDPRSYLQNG